MRNAGAGATWKVLKVFHLDAPSRLRGEAAGEAPLPNFLLNRLSFPTHLLALLCVFADT